MPSLSQRQRRDLRAAVSAEIDRNDVTITTLSRTFDDIVAGSELVNTDDEHDPEGSTIAFERSQLRSLLDQAQRDALDLQRTLDRIDDDGFGICDHCHEPIGVERLLALPTTTRCVRCAL